MAVKEGGNGKVNDALLLVLVLMLLLIPASTVWAVGGSTEPLHVGVIRTQGADPSHLRTSARGLEDFYGDRITVEILDVQWNVTKYDWREYKGQDQVLCDSFHFDDDVQRFQKDNSLDIVVFITQHDLYTPLADLVAGHSKPDTGTIIISYSRFFSTAEGYTREEARDKRIELASCHEMGHMFGYAHTNDRSLMRSYPLGTDALETTGELSFQDSMELDTRQAISQVAYRVPWLSWYSLNLWYALAVLPYLVVLSLCFQYAMASKGWDTVYNHKQLILAGLISLFMVFTSNYALAILAPLMACSFRSTIGKNCKRDLTSKDTMRLMGIFAVSLGIALLSLFINSLLSEGRPSMDEAYVMPHTLGNFAATLALSMALLFYLGQKKIRWSGETLTAYAFMISAAGVLSLWLLDPSYLIPLSIIGILAASENVIKPDVSNPSDGKKENDQR